MALIWEQMIDIQWFEVLQRLWHLMVAYLLAVPIGLDREQSRRQFGLRTFPLVAVVSCGFMMTGMSVIGSTGGEARVFQGVVTGIGFIGGGAIFKGEDTVSGTASAASIWNCGAIGLAVAFNRFEIAILLSVLNFLTLWLFGRVKREVLHEKQEDE
jgi:putative Mg2+ transporter-C (MgtC) family protein